MTTLFDLVKTIFISEPDGSHMSWFEAAKARGATSQEAYRVGLICGSIKHPLIVGKDPEAIEKDPVQFFENYCEYIKKWLSKSVVDGEECLILSRTRFFAEIFGQFKLMQVSRTALGFREVLPPETMFGNHAIKIDEALAAFLQDNFGLTAAQLLQSRNTPRRSNIPTDNGLESTELAR